MSCKVKKHLNSGHFLFDLDFRRNQAKRLRIVCRRSGNGQTDPFIADDADFLSDVRSLLLNRFERGFPMLSHNSLRGSESGFPGRNRLLSHNSFLQLHPGASEKFSSAGKNDSSVPDVFLRT